ncbi:hypothetical protein GUA46_06860 [Muricauda sp. HICW]|uniref:Toxin-antitoxin system YwqK family antitoxin n=1 Tax=Flagellimonas chongwuensis TaxID=2697365 RepID=A0A850NDJ4_9FLAO|nr:hypothetical protein [Allomuricauda chongwuensis]NVN18054.1 hypothetical protein [Allomuricauda chongwuensis]
MRILIILLILMLVSCKKKEVREQYPSGQLKMKYTVNNDNKKHGVLERYDEQGNLREISIYSDGIARDSSLFYDANSNLESIVFWNNVGEAYYQKRLFPDGKTRFEGPLGSNEEQVGKWKLYNQQGILSEYREYVNLSGESYMNQRWILNAQGDTIPGGNFYRAVSPDTAIVEKPYRIHFFLEQPVISYDSDLFVCLPKQDYTINPDFSNEQNIEWDTIPSLSIRFKEHERFRDNNHDVVFDMQNFEVGQKNIRGFLLEKEKTQKDTFDFVTRKIYFDLPVYISADSISQ